MEVYEGKENYIFISYAHKDSDVVLPIAQALFDNHYRIWFDAGIEAGSEWPENVAEHLFNSELVLVFLSKNSLDSQNCIREIHFAIAERKNILVIHLEDLKLSVGMRMQLGPLQALFFNRHKTQESFLKALFDAKYIDSCKKSAPRKSKASKRTVEPVEFDSPPIPMPTPSAVEKEEKSCNFRITSPLATPYKQPPLEFFNCNEVQPAGDEQETEEAKQTILTTLEANKIKGAEIPSVIFSPTVTTYNVKLPPTLSSNKVLALEPHLTIALQSTVKVYLNFEDGTISIEVPNKKRQFVTLGSMLSNESFIGAEPSSLLFPMGVDMHNRKVYGELTRMVHILVAGSTGTGKSIFLQTLILSLIANNSPNELRLILIDPKQVEFNMYEGLPHLATDKVITSPQMALKTLEDVIEEMELRYGLLDELFSEGKTAYNIDHYNKQVAPSQKLPKIVIIIDEVADLMLVSKKKTENAIMRLVQKARAVGIYVIIATQRPSTDVITGVLKSNFPTRIAFAVPSQVDSRRILDQKGAEKLLGKGDCLYMPLGFLHPCRVQTPYVSEKEVENVVRFIQENTVFLETTPDAKIPLRVDPLYIEALRFVLFQGNASVSIIQRKYAVTYHRACEIIGWMEEMKFISPYDGPNARKVLITEEEFNNKYEVL